MRPHDTTPLKRCSLCKQEFPATTEYFTHDRVNKDGFRPQCKACYRQRQKDWRRAAPKRYAKYQQQQYRKDPERMKQRVRKWQQTAKGKEARKKYREQNREHFRIYFHEHYLKNRTERIQAAKEWRHTNPLKRRAIILRRRARERDLPVSFNEMDWQFALDYFDGCCAACGRPAGLFHTLAADHFIPLPHQDCPGTVPTNIVPLCHGLAGCNNRKQDRDPHEWLFEQFGGKQGRAILIKIQAFFSLVRQS